MKKNIDSLVFTLVAFAGVFTGCASISTKESTGVETGKIIMTDWFYNEADEVWYKTGIQYCSNPKDLTYETLGLYVPGKYFTGTKNEDGTWTVTVNKKNEVNGYTAENAPYVMPIETPGYMSLKAPTGYVSEVKSFTDQGFIYLFSGARGREHGAPAGVTDFKAAIRYVRSNSSILPGDTKAVFTFGMSGGGAQSALLGTTGDSKLYESYLQEIGAVMNESDEVCGSMAWCPVTSLDIADAAYEWYLGASRTDLDDFTKELSTELAACYGDYINNLQLRDDAGNLLALEQAEDGNYTKGSYYDWTVRIIEDSLEKFLTDTQWPYEAGTKSKGFQMPVGMNGMKKDRDMLKPMDMKSKTDVGDLPFEMRDNITRNNVEGFVKLNGIYNNPEEYIAALNKEKHWVDYDKATGSVMISDLASFVQGLKVATKNTGAFDALDKSQGENILFGYGDGTGAHFDSYMTETLKDSEYSQAYKTDRERTDSVGNTVQTRINMYNPMYFISECFEGYETSKVAKFWRIRSGIFQGDTATGTEANLAQALKNYGIESVDFEAVWGQYHTKAERIGDSTANFISWVNDCMKD